MVLLVFACRASFVCLFGVYCCLSFVVGACVLRRCLLLRLVCCVRVVVCFRLCSLLLLVDCCVLVVVCCLFLDDRCSLFVVSC